MTDNRAVNATLNFDPNGSPPFVFSGQGASSQNIDADGNLSWPQAGGPITVNITLQSNGGGATFPQDTPMLLAQTSSLPPNTCPPAYDPGNEFSQPSLSPDYRTLSFTDYNNQQDNYSYALNIMSNGQAYRDDPKIINRR